MELAKILLIGVTLTWATSAPTAAEGSYFEAENFLEAAPFLQPPHRGYGYGFGYHQVPLNFHNNPPPRNNNNHNNEAKQVPAVVPVSPVFQVEVMKAMAQLDEQKPVTLYVIPQNSLQVVPHAQQRLTENLSLPSLFNKYPGTLQLTNPFLQVGPNHVAAVEVPLEKPLIIGSAKAEVLAPAGFTVLLDGPRGHPLAYPFTTGILLAPVPVGTIISSDTPVVLTTLYAVPSLPALPSAIKILANFFADSQGTQLTTHPGSSRPIPAISPVALAPPPQFVNRYPAPGHGPQAFPISPVHKQQTTFIPLPGPTVAPAQIVGDRLKDEVNGPATGFINSKESPFLLQLREESLKRQIKELQDELVRLQQASSPVAF